MKNPKTVLSIIIAILTITYDLFVGDFTLVALLASLTSAVTIIWKYFNPEESVFVKVYKLIGGSLPEDDDEEDEEEEDPIPVGKK